VTPRDFEGVIVAEHPDLYLPLEFQADLYGEAAKHDRGHLWLSVFARLNPDVDRALASAEMHSLLQTL
jgi:putative ABC transport system permease protein